MKQRMIIRKGLVFKLSIVLFIVLFALVLLGSAVAQGSGVTNEGFQGGSRCGRA